MVFLPEVDIANVDAQIESLPRPTGAASDELIGQHKAENHADLLLVKTALETFLGPSSVLSFADGTTQTATLLHGVTIANTSTAVNGRAQIRLRSGTSGGTILATIPLAPGEGVDYSFVPPRTVPAGTLYFQLVTGAVEGAVFFS